MARGNHKPDPYKQRSDESHLQWRSRVAHLKDLEAAKQQKPVTKEAERHGQYEDSWWEMDGKRVRVKVNRGGSTIQRWMNQKPDDVLGDGERAAIRYCQSLWVRIDYKCPAMVRVDNGRDGESEHEALAELAALKTKLPRRYWEVFENICRFEQPSNSRHDRLTVGFVAGMIALWRGL